MTTESKEFYVYRLCLKTEDGDGKEIGVFSSIRKIIKFKEMEDKAICRRKQISHFANSPEKKNNMLNTMRRAFVISNHVELVGYYGTYSIERIMVH